MRMYRLYIYKWKSKKEDKGGKRKLQMMGGSAVHWCLRIENEK